MDSENLIIEAVRSGDVRQFEKIVLRHSTNIFALAESILKNREDAEEATQDVFVKAYNSLTRFRGDSKLSTFLYRICFNECINRTRSRKIKFHYEVFGSEELAVNDGFYSMKKSEQKKFLASALKHLPSDYSGIITLFYLEELTHKEIMEITGLTLANVKVKLHRAKNALSKAINELLKNEVKDLI